MSKVDSRNYQLRLIYNDEDLPKPKHDQIMLWLENFVRDETKWPELIPVRFAKMSSIEENEIYRPDGRYLEPQQYDNHYYETVRKLHPTSSVEVAASADAPGRSSSFKNLTWEYALYDRSNYEGRPGARLGFVDMMANFDSDVELRHVTTRKFQYDPKADDQKKYTLLETSAEWRVIRRVVQIFFEVKTEIRSIGELMRQMKLYMSSATVSQAPYRRLIVVAPRHDEASRVLRDHGIGFIPYEA